MSIDIGFSAQTPALPTSGGAMGGLGATFTPELHTGSGSCAIRLDCPNGPNDIGPRLHLRYETTGGNGVFGLDTPVTTGATRCCWKVRARSCPIRTLEHAG